MTGELRNGFQDKYGLSTFSEKIPDSIPGIQSPQNFGEVSWVKFFVKRKIIKISRPSSKSKKKKLKNDLSQILGIDMNEINEESFWLLFCQEQKESFPDNWDFFVLKNQKIAGIEVF